MAEPTYRYVPIIRWKQNERAALRNLSDEGRRKVTPLIALSPQQYIGPRRSSSKAAKTSVISPSEYFVTQVLDAWGPTRVFVDASELSGTTSRHDFDDIAESARTLGANIVPATRLEAPSEYLNSIMRVSAQDNRGMAFRLTLSEMVAASDWFSRRICDPKKTDLIIDLAGSVSSVAALGVSVAPAFASLYRGNQWRSVTLAGGCIPSTLSSFDHGATAVPREELSLWRLLSAANLPYRLDFGDYGSISPDASTKSIPASVPINAKYSLSERFLVFRGVKITGPGAVPMDHQLRNYAKAIVAHPTRGALSHCWADGRIDQMATDTSISMGNAGVWVGLNMNRHIEVTRYVLP